MDPVTTGGSSRLDPVKVGDAGRRAGSGEAECDGMAPGVAVSSSSQRGPRHLSSTSHKIYERISCSDLSGSCISSGTKLMVMTSSNRNYMN